AAGALRSRRAADNATYDANIGQNVTWSSNATQGYNNWDIAYPAASGGGGGGSGGGGGGYMPGRNNGYVTWGSSTVSSAPAATPPSTPAAPVGRKICATVCLHVL
ncbi:MAG: hypothetical protein LBH66_09595, partial [Oscillospiraceae bacterium]|nr:hypothetical protein [Oscillospiraceae bacterium]